MSDVRSFAATAGSDDQDCDSDASTIEPLSLPPTPSTAHSSPLASPRIPETSMESTEVKVKIMEAEKYEIAAARVDYQELLCKNIPSMCFSYFLGFSNMCWSGKAVLGVLRRPCKTSDRDLNCGGLNLVKSQLAT